MSSPFSKTGHTSPATYFRRMTGGLLITMIRCTSLTTAIGLDHHGVGEGRSHSQRHLALHPGAKGDRPFSRYRRRRKGSDRPSVRAARNACHAWPRDHSPANSVGCEWHVSLSAGCEFRDGGPPPVRLIDSSVSSCVGRPNGGDSQHSLDGLGAV